MSETMSGKVEQLGLNVGDLPNQVVDEAEVHWEGFVGDKHYGLTRKSGSSQKMFPKGTLVRNVRQVSVVSQEELAQIAERLGVPQVEPDWLGANLALSGIPQLTQLPSGTRLMFENGVSLVVEGDNTPCVTAGGCLQAQYPEQAGLTNRFPKQAMGKRGLIAWVERPGAIRRGEGVRVLLPREAPPA